MPRKRGTGLSNQTIPEPTKTEGDANGPGNSDAIAEPAGDSGNGVTESPESIIGAGAVFTGDFGAGNRQRAGLADSDGSNGNAAGGNGGANSNGDFVSDGQNAAGVSDGAGGNQEGNDPSQFVGQRKRGRPRKYGTAAGTPRPETVALGKKSLASNIQGLHELLAVVLKEPEFVLQAKEADALADAAQSVIDAYGLAAVRGLGVWGGVIGTLAAVYGPRAVRIYGKRKFNAAAKAAESQNPFEGINNV